MKKGARTRPCQGWTSQALSSRPSAQTRKAQSAIPSATKPVTKVRATASRISHSSCGPNRREAKLCLAGSSTER